MKQRTTLKIDEAVMSRLKKESLRRGSTMSELVESALRLFFQSEKLPRKVPPLPKFKSGGPLVDIADRDALYQAMEGRRYLLSMLIYSSLFYAADEDSPFHQGCRDRVESWRRQSSPWYVTVGILYEFLRVVTYPRVFRNPWTITEAWKFIEAILAAPALDILIPGERHIEAASEVIKDLPFLSGNLLYDARTAILMKESEVKRIYTRDTDFHRFPFLKSADPTV